MPVPTAISELSTTPGSNSPSGADSPSVLDDHLRTAYAFIRTLSDDKLDASSGVALTGNQTIAGVKTFSSNIVGNITGNASGTALNVTGTVALANGGTGATTAAAAFTALKQAASTTATGVVELATDAEAQTGTDAARAVTPDNLGATVLGMGQTWQDFTASRAFGTTYTNTTGRTIAISVAAGVSSSAQLNLTVGGLIVTQNSAASAEGQNAYAVVPPGATYVASLSAGSLTFWRELR